MSDNLTVTPGAGAYVATDDVSGVHYQVVKIAIGSDGSATLLPGDGTNGVDVDVTRLPALPAGTNNIGDVDVASLPALPAGDNNIGNVDIVTMPAVTVTNGSTAGNQTTMIDRLGSLTETVPASDTASSGLNGRLQRLLQRMTTLIGLFPSSIGGKTSAGSLSVTMATDQAAISTSLSTRLDPVNDRTATGLYNGGVAGTTADYNTQDAARSFNALASAARTTTTTSADFTNNNWRGCYITLAVTAASGTGGLQVRLQGKDPLTGTYVSINAAPTAIVATGTVTYYVYPGGGGTNAQMAQVTYGSLPPVFRVSVTHGDASSYTYSVSILAVV